MPASVNGGGDQLARGAVRATFRSANVSQEKWDSIWGTDGGPKKNYSEKEDTITVGPPKRKRGFTPVKK